jgi:DivIVA domain-containing protein
VIVLTPEDVRNQTFAMTRSLTKGYDVDEVDAFLERVEAELTRLTQEADALRAQLAVARQAPPAPVAAAPAAPPAAPQPAAVNAGEQATALLQMAQRTHDETVADARVKAEAMLTEAHNRAAAMESDAAAKQRQTLAGLEADRANAQRKVDELRAFEREYRTRLKSYLEGQLTSLHHLGEELPAPPPAAAAAPAAPATPPPSPASPPVAAAPAAPPVAAAPAAQPVAAAPTAPLAAPPTPAQAPVGPAPVTAAPTVAAPSAARPPAPSTAPPVVPPPPTAPTAPAPTAPAPAPTATTMAPPSAPPREAD